LFYVFFPLQARILETRSLIGRGCGHAITPLRFSGFAIK
jgi:hypothetical protein